MMRFAVFFLSVAINSSGLFAADLSLAKKPVTENPDKAAILALAEEILAMVGQDKADRWAEILHPGGHTLATVPGRTPEMPRRVAIASTDRFTAATGDDPKPYFERFTGPTTIQIDGDYAHLWGPFDFWIRDRFSHCGVNSFDFVKTSGRWQVVNLAWTMRKTDCPTSLLAAPKAGK